MRLVDSDLVDTICIVASKYDERQMWKEASVFDNMLKSLAGSDDRFQQGLREGLDSAVTLLSNAQSMADVTQITEYLRDVKDNIPLEGEGSNLHDSPIETPEELDSLMAFDG